MGKSIDVRDFRYSIYLNNEQAGKSVTELRSKLDGLKQELASVEQEGGKGSDYWKSVKQEIDGLNKELIKTKQVAGIAGLSIKELKNLRTQATSLRNDLDPVSDEFKEWDKFIKQCNTRLDELGVSANRVEKTVENGSSGFKKYWGAAAAGIASITAALYTAERLTEKADKMDDIYADVIKTTGMTREQVKDLNEEFKKIDTRTAREELNALAADAGKLGINGKDDILGFVDAGNQIRVALDDLGDDAIKEIGKMADIYEKSTSEITRLDMKGKLLAVGSAINELGSASNANEKYIVEYTQRLGGVASQSGITIQQIMGFASAADQAGQKMELSTTALQVFITKVMEEPAKFARLAGVEVSQFTEMLKTDANEAILSVLTAMNQKGGFASLVPVFKEMNLNGSGAISVLSGLAGNIDKVREAQDLANEAFSEATSLTNEYNIKNNNFAAQTEKQKKRIDEIYITLGEKLQPVVLKSRGSVISLFESIIKLEGVLKGSKTTLSIIAVALGLYTISLKGAWIESKILAFWSNIVLGSINKLKAAMIANPMAAYTLGLSLVIAALIDLRRNIKSVSTEQKILNEINKEVHNSTSNEIRTLEMLKKILFDSTKGYNERKNALDKIQEIVPEYQASLTQEGKLINNNSDALDRYIKQIKLTAQVQSASSKLTDAESNMIEYMNSLGKDSYKYINTKMAIANPLNENKSVAEIALDNGLTPLSYNTIEKKRETFQKEIDIYKKMLESYSDDLSKISVIENNNNQNNEDNKDVVSEDLKTKLAELEKFYKERQLIHKQSLYDEKITEEEYKDRIAIVELNYLEVKKQTLLDFGQDITDIQLTQLDKLIAESKRKYAELKSPEAPEEIEERDSSLDELASLEKFRETTDGKLAINQAMYDAGLIQTKEYEARKAEIERQYRDERIENELFAMQTISSIASSAASLYSAMQNKEVADTKKKYNKRIELAGDNAETIAEIEAEQAAEIAKINAQYADKQFALTSIGIIADTAAGIMKTYAEYGYSPVGIAASAVLGLQGAMQLAVANQQREAAKAEYYLGGFTSKGDPTKEAGIVHQDEFVANHKAVRNPHVKKFLDVFDIAQKDGSISMLNTSQILKMVTTGYYSGGYTSEPASSYPTIINPGNNNDRELTEAIRRLNNILDSGIKTEIPISGSNGIAAGLEKYKRLKQNATRS